MSSNSPTQGRSYETEHLPFDPCHVSLVPPRGHPGRPTSGRGTSSSGAQAATSSSSHSTIEHPVNYDSDSSSDGEIDDSDPVATTESRVPYDSDSSSDGEIDDSDPVDHPASTVPHYPARLPLPHPSTRNTVLMPHDPYVQLMRLHHEAQRDFYRAYYAGAPEPPAEITRLLRNEPHKDEYDEYGRMTTEAWDRYASKGFYVDGEGRLTSVHDMRRRSPSPPPWAVEEHSRRVVRSPVGRDDDVSERQRYPRGGVGREQPRTENGSRGWEETVRGRGVGRHGYPSPSPWQVVPE